jgi:hypothetical protein
MHPNAERVEPGETKELGSLSARLHPSAANGSLGPGLTVGWP